MSGGNQRHPRTLECPTERRQIGEVGQHIGGTCRSESIRLDSRIDSHEGNAHTDGRPDVPEAVPRAGESFRQESWRRRA